MDRTIISSAVNARRDQLAVFLRELIAIPSFSGQEQKAIRRLRQEMIDLDYDEVRIDQMGNLIGRIGSGERQIAFDGHVDTVGVGEIENWTDDPFTGRPMPDNVSGRGAVDQKSGLACAVYAGALVKQLGIPPHLTLWVTATVLEEDLEGLCWHHLADEEGLCPEAVLLTEPTNLDIYLGQRGRLEIKVATTGKSSHGAMPDEGESAVYKMQPIVQQVEQLHPQLKTDPLLGPGSVVVTDIRSSAPSLCAVPDSAEIHLDRRLTVGESEETALAQIRALTSVRQAGARVWIPQYQTDSHTGLACQTKASFPTWLMELTHPLVQQATAVYQNQFEQPARTGVWRFSTNGVATRGSYGWPTIGFGPGDETLAHTPREVVSIDDLARATEFYTAFSLCYR